MKIFELQILHTFYVFIYMHITSNFLFEKCSIDRKIWCFKFTFSVAVQTHRHGHFVTLATGQKRWRINGGFGTSFGIVKPVFKLVNTPQIGATVHFLQTFRSTLEKNWYFLSQKTYENKIGQCKPQYLGTRSTFCAARPKNFPTRQSGSIWLPTRWRDPANLILGALRFFVCFLQRCNQKLQTCRIGFQSGMFLNNIMLDLFWRLDEQVLTVAHN